MGFRKLVKGPEILHICSALLIVILSFFVFMDTQEYFFFIPVIFTLASLLCISDWIFILTGKQQHRKVPGVILIAGVFFLIMAILSSLTFGR
ncbi:MAG: hypothetical protein ACLRZ7_01560 [Lachnospiraceae bacterium]